MPNLSILGCDDDVLRIAERAAADAKWRVVIGYDVPTAWREKLLQAAPGIELRTNWESLLADSPHVVLVGRCRTPDQADDQLRKLVQAAIPLVVSYPLASAIFALELEMIRRDARGPIGVVYPGSRRRPVANFGSTGPDGIASAENSATQIVVERRGVPTDTLTPYDHLARDLHWLWPMLGDVQQVTAVAAGNIAGGGDSAERGGSLHVQAQCDSGTLVRWSFTPGTASAASQLRLERADSLETWEARPESSAGAWTRISAAETSAEFDSVSEALETLRAVAESSRGSSTSNGAERAGLSHLADEWSAAVRALEAVDAAQHSARRGRTIELQKTQVSEQSTFKGVMSAVGCLLLLSIPLILVIASLVDRLQASFRPRLSGGDAAGAATTLDGPREGDADRVAASETGVKERHFPWFAVVLVTPIVLFLLLQLLQLVFLPAANSSAASNSPAAAPRAPPTSNSEIDCS